MTVGGDGGHRHRPHLQTLASRLLPRESICLPPTHLPPCSCPRGASWTSSDLRLLVSPDDTAAAANVLMAADSSGNPNKRVKLGFFFPQVWFWPSQGHLATTSTPPHRSSHCHSFLLRPRPAFHRLGGELEGKSPAEPEDLQQSTLTY